MEQRPEQTGQPPQGEIAAAFREVYRSPQSAGPPLAPSRVTARTEPQPLLSFGPGPAEPGPAVPSFSPPLSRKPFRKRKSRIPGLLVCCCLLAAGWYWSPQLLPAAEQFLLRAAACSAGEMLPANGEAFLLRKFSDLLWPGEEQEAQPNGSSQASREPASSSISSRPLSESSSAAQSASSGSTVSPAPSQPEPVVPSASSQQSSSAAPPPPRPADAGDIYEVCLPNTYPGNPQYLSFGSGYIRNDTKVAAGDLPALLQQQPDLPVLADGSVEVLLICTHSTESYEMADYGWYDPDYSCRTTDQDRNMIAVAERIAQKLRQAGIGVVQDTRLYDHPSYNGAYQRSAASIREYLARYPTIKVVLDIHRDAIENDQGLRTKPTVEVKGKKAAQIMIISGCDDGSGNLPAWRENLRFAARIQDRCAGIHPNLMRPLYFCYRNYNQALTKGSLLVEVGGHANTLEEACYSGELFGEALAAVLLDLAGRG